MRSGDLAGDSYEDAGDEAEQPEDSNESIGDSTKRTISDDQAAEKIHHKPDKTDDASQHVQLKK
jgi:hypothetical protein